MQNQCCKQISHGANRTTTKNVWASFFVILWELWCPGDPRMLSNLDFICWRTPYIPFTYLPQVGSLQRNIGCRRYSCGRTYNIWYISAFTYPLSSPQRGQMSHVIHLSQDPWHVCYLPHVGSTERAQVTGDTSVVGLMNYLLLTLCRLHREDRDCRRYICRRTPHRAYSPWSCKGPAARGYSRSSKKKGKSHKIPY